MPWTNKDAVIHGTLYGTACLPKAFSFERAVEAIKEDPHVMFQALMNACYSGNTTMAQVLINHGAVAHAYHFYKAWSQRHLRLAAMLVSEIKQGSLFHPHPFKAVLEAKLALRKTMRAVKIIERHWSHALVSPYTKVGRERLKRAVASWIQEDVAIFSTIE